LEMSTRLSLPMIAWAMLRIGAVAFGGLGATLALLQSDLVDRRGWLQSSDVAVALAVYSGSRCSPSRVRSQRRITSRAVLLRR
jgi:Chromate transporter